MDNFLKKYAIIRNGEIGPISEHPGWRNDNGELVSDEFLNNHGYRPIIFDRPEYDPETHELIETPKDEWVIEDDYVYATVTLRPYTYVELLNKNLARIHEEYEHKVYHLTYSYPEAEKKSWHIQLQEAESVLSEDGKETLWIDNASKNSGVDRFILADTIKARGDTYKIFHGEITGTLHSLRNQMYTVEDDENTAYNLAAIVWPEDE